MVGYNTVQGVDSQRFLLTTIEAQFLMKKLCLARKFDELLSRDGHIRGGSRKFVKHAS
jgi:hypothetical protein